MCDVYVASGTESLINRRCASFDFPFPTTPPHTHRQGLGRKHGHVGDTPGNGESEAEKQENMRVPVTTVGNGVQLRTDSRQTTPNAPEKL